MHFDGVFSFTWENPKKPEDSYKGHEIEHMKNDIVDWDFIYEMEIEYL